MKNGWKKLTGEIPRPDPVPLRAGPFTLELHGCDIRHIRLGNRETVQRIYMGLRDQNWGTLESHVKEMTSENNDDSFSIAFKAFNRKGGIAFDWEGSITGSAAGKIVYSFTGVAQSDFPRARISLCLLYPYTVRECECQVRHNDGTVESKELPRYISPHQPFMDIASLTMKIPGIGETVATFTGDVFEMEDQRNWTDASFKIYGIPIDSPAPVMVHKGEQVHQCITLECRNLVQKENVTTAHESSVNLAPQEEVWTMPLVGVSFSSGDIGHEQFVKALTPNIVRVYLDYIHDSHANIAKQFDSAINLGVPLLIQPFFHQEASADLDHALKLLATVPRNVVWCVSPLGENCDVCHPEWLEVLRPLGLPLGYGSDGFPVHVNRCRPDNVQVEYCVFPALPQVHSFDNTSRGCTR